MSKMLILIMFFISIIQANAVDINELINDALISIKEVDSANTSQLVDRFNQALLLVKEYEQGRFESCANNDDCISKASEILNSIISEANSIKDKKVNMDMYINIFIYAPITAIIISFAFTSIYTSIKSYMERRLMKMNVKEIEE